MRLKFLAIAVLGFFTLACSGATTSGGKSDGKKSGGDPDEIICCEWGGAKGTSTRKKCEEYDPPGKVLPKKKCK